MLARPAPFDVEAFLSSSGVARTIRSYAVGAVLFAQGEAADTVFYIQHGGVKLSVLSRVGREAVVAMLAAGDFVGEGALAGQSLRIASATAVIETSALVVEKQEMMRVLHEEHALSDRFIEYTLTRTTRSRVNFFMNKFRKLGFVEYNGSIKVNPSLLSVVLHD